MAQTIAKPPFFLYYYCFAVDLTNRSIEHMSNSPKTLDELLSGADIKKSGKGGKEPIRTLTEEHRKMIMALVGNKAQLKADQDAVKDDIKAIADRLGIKAGDVNRIVSLVIQEQEKGGAIQASENILDLAGQVLNQNDDE